MIKNILIKCLLLGVIISTGVLADMSVDKSNGLLTVTSNISGIVMAKVIGPNDEVIVNLKEEGNSFTWTPSGVDGAYRYDVRVVPVNQEESSSNGIQTTQEDTSAKSDYAGGSVEVVDGQMTLDVEIPTKEEE